MLNKKVLRADIILLSIAGIWGFAFVAQKTGMEFLGPYSFNGLRFLIGSVSLLPLIIFRRVRKQTALTVPPRRFFLASLALGIVLCLAASLQQVALLYTTTGHCGFITGLYVVLVPVAGIFVGKKTGLSTWIGAVLTLAGLFFLSTDGSFGSVNRGDVLTAISALFWTCQVLLIDYLVRSIDAVEISCGAFFWCGLFALIIALVLKEPITVARLRDGLAPLLYGSIGSVGVAYTLQAVAQKDSPPAHAAIFLCLEGVFAALGGFLILHDPLGGWTLLGFALMLGGMLLSQLEIIRSKS